MQLTAYKVFILTDEPVIFLYVSVNQKELYNIKLN